MTTQQLAKLAAALSQEKTAGPGAFVRPLVAKAVGALPGLFSRGSKAVGQHVKKNVPTYTAGAGILGYGAADSAVTEGTNHGIVEHLLRSPVGEKTFQLPARQPIIAQSHKLDEGLADIWQKRYTDAMSGKSGLRGRMAASDSLQTAAGLSENVATWLRRRFLTANPAAVHKIDKVFYPGSSDRPQAELPTGVSWYSGVHADATPVVTSMMPKPLQHLHNLFQSSLPAQANAIKDKMVPERPIRRSFGQYTLPPMSGAWYRKFPGALALDSALPSSRLRNHADAPPGTGYGPAVYDQLRDLNYPTITKPRSRLGP